MRKRPWMKKAGLALLCVAILTPLAAFALSNLFLLSPRGREFIAGKLGRGSSLETSVQGCTWSPWNGVTIYGLRVEQPEALRPAFSKPLLSVRSIRVHPGWRALLGKKLVVKGVEIVKPDLCIPIELLSHIPHEEEAPAIAATAPAPPPASAPEAAATQVSPPNPPLAGINPPGGETPRATKASVPGVRTPNLWIGVRDGRLEIVSLMSPSPLFEASGINGRVPVSGKPAESKISVSRLKGLGQQAPGKIDLPLKWVSPLLGIGATGGEISGLDFVLGGQIGLLPGIPFRIDASIPTQNDREIRIGGKISAKLGTVAAQGSARGYLIAPASWQGQWLARTSGVDVRIEGQKSRFDEGQALLLFRNGALRCMDARLSGEQATIIGNGMLLSDGRMAANTRIIAAPETLLAISRFTQPGGEPTHLTPLSTPQRAALDLQFFGRPGNLMYKPDPMAAAIPLP